MRKDRRTGMKPGIIVHSGVKPSEKKENWSERRAFLQVKGEDFFKEIKTQG